MAYKIKLPDRAIADAAYSYYAPFSESTVAHFSHRLSTAVDTLKEDPFFKIMSENVHGLPVKKFLICSYLK